MTAAIGLGLQLRLSSGRKVTSGRRDILVWRHCLALMMIVVASSFGTSQGVEAAESSLSSGTLFAAPPGTPSATPSITPPAAPPAAAPAPSLPSETTVPPSRPTAPRSAEESAGSANTSVPALTRRVTDQTGTLDAATVSRIESTLQALESEKGAQIAVLMIPTTDGESIEQYAVRVFEAWNLGRKKVDDGALLVVAKNDRTLRIEVGYGLEGAVTDAQASRIIREQITPRFRNGDFSGGVEAGVNALAGLVQGEALPPVEKAKANAANTVRNLPTEALMAAGLVLIILPVWAAALIGAAAGLLFSGSLPIGLIAGVAGIVLSIIGKAVLPGGAARAMSRRGRAGGGFGGFGGGFGGGGGGGFGGGGGGFGGGGGRSGGGGASGSW